MKRRTRWIIGSAVALVILGLLICLGLTVVLPALVREQVEGIFGKAGLGEVSFQLKRATLWQTDLETISAGKNRLLQIGQVQIRYEPLEALRGRIESVRVRQAQLTVALDESLPFDGASGGRGGAAPRLPVDAIELESCTLRLTRQDHAIDLPLEGSLLHTPSGIAQLNLRSAVGTAPVTISGTIDLAAGQADLRAQTTNLDLALVAPLMPADAMRGVEEIGGHADVSVEHQRSAAGNRTSGRALLRDGWFVGSGAYEGEMRGIDADVTLTGISPLNTPPEQAISADLVKYAGEELSGVSIRFQAREGKLTVGSAQARWAEGRLVAAAPFTIDPGSGAVEVAVAVQRVALQKILDLTTQGKVTGTGFVNGMIPIRIEGSQVRFGDGYLESIRPGTLRVGEAVGQLGQILDQNDPRFGREPQMQQLKKDILASLEDFQYDHLRADLKRDERGLLVAVRIQGQGRAVRNVPIDLTLNTRGLEEAVNTYLHARSRVSNVGR